MEVDRWLAATPTKSKSDEAQLLKIGLAAHWLARISFRRLIKRHYPLPTDVDNNDTTATIIEKLADVISSDYGRVSKRIYPLGAPQLIFIILL